MIPKIFENIPPSVKRIGVSAGWVAGLILISALLWGFTQPVRNRALLNSVNRILDRTAEERRLAAPIPLWGMPGRASQAGSWFITDTSGDWAVVFTVVSGGVFTPALAFISRDGIAGSIIPLSAHGETAFQRLPKAYLRIYVRRIETSYALLRRAWEEKNE
jgi:hypothetical protein